MRPFLAPALPCLRRLWWVLLALVIFTGATLAALADTLALVNAGFEQVDEATGLPRGWTAWTKPGLAAYTLAMAHSGVAAARVTDDSPTGSQGLRCQPVPIEPGKTYEATVWVRITDLQAGGFALYLEYWKAGTRVQDTAVSTGRVGEWTQLKVRATAPAQATEATLLVYASSATIGEAYYDDAALAPVP